MHPLKYLKLTLLLWISVFPLWGLAPSMCALAAQEPALKPGTFADDFDIKAEQQKTAQAVRIFSDGEKSKEQRLDAAKDIGAVTERDGEKLLGVFRNKKEPDEIRIMALRKAPVTGQLIKEAAFVLKERQGNGRLRQECVRFLHAAVSFGPAGHMSQSEMDFAVAPALRFALTEDSDKDVRHGAAGYLVLTKDFAAHKIFRSALESDSIKAPFSKVDCIRYLAAYHDRDDFPIIARYAEDKDANVRAAAAEARTADETLLRVWPDLLSNPEEKPKVKIAVLRGLSVNQARRFPAQTLPVIENRKEDTEVRACAIEELAKVLKRHHQDITDFPFDRAHKIIDDISSRSDENSRLRAAARVYLKIEGQLRADGLR